MRRLFHLVLLIAVTGAASWTNANLINRYDSQARLDYTALISRWGNVLDGQAYQFDPLGLRTNIVRYFGLDSNSVSAGYDSIGQITSWKGQESSGLPRLNEQLAYTYDKAHNLYARVNGVTEEQVFNYDPLNELTNAIHDGALFISGNTPAPATNVTVAGQAAQTYGDFTFVMTNAVFSNGPSTYQIVAQNAFGLKATNNLTLTLPSPVNPQYDANGSLTNDGTRAFAYDMENRLTNVNVAGAWKSEFAYDGLGRRRIERDYAWQSGAWNKTNELHFIYDGWLLVQVRDASNNVLVTYTRGLDLSGTRPGAGGIGGLLARTDSNGSTYYHSDGEGNVTTLIDGYQLIQARYLFDPFGRLVGMWGPLGPVNQMRFSSFYTTPSGIVLSPTRPYFPELQRWGSQDPIGEWGGINLYGFVGNSPPNYVDPLGLSLFDYIPGIGPGIAQAQGAAALQNQLSANGYQNMQDFQSSHPGYNGGDTTAGDQQGIAGVANIASGAADLYVNGMQQLAAAGVVTKGTETAAQGIADAAGEGWLSKLWKKCKPGGKKPPKGPQPPRYYISDGVRRALAARESGDPSVNARLVTPGQPDQLMQVPLDRLGSPKAAIDSADPRFSPDLRPDYPPIEVQPSGLPGQVQTTPLQNVQIRRP